MRKHKFIEGINAAINFNVNYIVYHILWYYAIGIHHTAEQYNLPIIVIDTHTYIQYIGNNNNTL